MCFPRFFVVLDTGVVGARVSMNNRFKEISSFSRMGLKILPASVHFQGHFTLPHICYSNNESLPQALISESGFSGRNSPVCCIDKRIYPKE